MPFFQKSIRAHVSHATRRSALLCAGLCVALSAWSSPTAPLAARDERNGLDETSWRNQASDMVVRAMNFIGVPYARGGTSADGGFDCSGFTRYLFEHSLGLVLPRRADEQARASSLAKVARDQLEPGDLVFFNTAQRQYSHVGIYIGDNKFVHAPRTGANVRVDSMDGTYWRQRYNGARRATDETAASGKAASAR